ncbi:hypothetical protein BD309DRAFT_954682 [Dichomitus squalens]|uniref:uncharacterized protein n=1 Tax=Dichomitus squalens (strain LYAD-421) TaxID=732165 RepID=UPI00044146E2|nr:uncharacterized protein DICSQDRAFT_131589 [Dichomitus squalens LYAD-421 SS1]EJF67317.1 hypothetical protein DICSQDRAFT_131589 [Dichomitus squalens LYAD-421 SS1]TBU46131.1 hypothetical protein BD309DRAFT_954682 [Dichomitus squalens]
MLRAASRIPTSLPVSLQARTYAISLRPPVVYPRMKDTPRVYAERKTYLYNQYTRLLQGTSTAPLLLFEHSDFSATRLIQLRADIAAAVTKHAGTVAPSLSSPTPSPPPTIPTFTVLRTSLFGVALREMNNFDDATRKEIAKTVTGSLAVLSFPELNPPQLKAVLRVLARSVPPRKPKTPEQLEEEKKAVEAAFVPGRRPKRQKPTPVPDLKLLGALIEGRLFKAEGVRSVAELPTLDALRAQIVGLLSAPAAQLSMVLSEASGGKLKRTLEGFKKSLEEPEGQAQDGQTPPP